MHKKKDSLVTTGHSRSLRVRCGSDASGRGKFMVYPSRAPLHHVICNSRRETVQTIGADEAGAPHGIDDGADGVRGGVACPAWDRGGAGGKQVPGIDGDLAAVPGGGYPRLPHGVPCRQGRSCEGHDRISGAVHRRRRLRVLLHGHPDAAGHQGAPGRRHRGISTSATG